MRITLITDNTVYKKGLRSEWGFACLVEIENTPRILFDTGASGGVLLHNMEKLNIDPRSIDCVFISHNHWDHTGGLDDFLKLNSNVKLYVPYYISTGYKKLEVIRVKDSVQVYENVFSTGELQGIEQSMAVKTDKGVVVIVGCSHPGVGNILVGASDFGNPIALIGGLHGFNQFELVKNLDLICATHCTQHKEEIKELYTERFTDGGAGRVIEI
ncbi:MBL fold metallo-hydrolase [bacterium]|nr:MBL fold metallo-hydrolase [bacterium]